MIQGDTTPLQALHQRGDHRRWNAWFLSKEQDEVLQSVQIQAGSLFLGGDIVEARGGEVVLVPLVPNLSTTGIIEKIAAMQSPEEK